MASLDGSNNSGQSTPNNGPMLNNLIITDESELSYLRSIDSVLKSMLNRGSMPSQTNAQNNARASQNFQDSRYNFRNNGIRRNSSRGFLDSFENSLWNSFLGPDFKRNLVDISNEFARKFGMSVQDIPGELGRQLGDQAATAFKNSSIGRMIDDAVGNVVRNSTDWIRNRLGLQSSQSTPSSVTPSTDEVSDIASNILNSSGSNPIDTVLNAAQGAPSPAVDAAGQAAGNLAQVGGVAADATGQIASMASSISAACPYILLAVVAIELLSEAIGPAIEGFKKLYDAASKAANRYNETRKFMLQQEQERIKADIETLVRAPFEILEDAAKRVYEAWDNNLRLINATQGYSKSDLQDLMANFAERLRSEGLSKYVSGADLTNNLTKVIESGLSGTVAEEFAYIATVLQAAVPTQDFFSYADTYASLAANAVKNGKSQTEAIEYANQELLTFANNILSASRELSGGFSTGLKDAKSLFEQSAQIATASRTGSASEIASVLTAVAAVTGSIAPDLATSMTDAIVKAATGGNSTEIVALRSLAGINASNTEFLKQVAETPQKIFATLFTNLAKMQNMSNDNYMEVAEGLSSVFGISMDAFARIDFNYLADAISQMNVNSTALDDNLALLKSGETTTNAEQLRMQQINKYMIDEGLAYVLDNEAARSIQEHMWNEQIALELQEATYGVELKGAALEFLEGIRSTIDNIMSFLNPLSWFGKIADLVGTAQEAKAQDEDIRQLLELGKVGSGSLNSLYQLTTRGVKLDLTDSLISKFGGVSAYETISGVRSSVSSLFRPLDTLMDQQIKLGGLFRAYTAQSMYEGSSGLSGNLSSRYNWGMVDKSTAAAIFNAPYKSASAGYSALRTEGAATSIATSAIEKMLSSDYMSSFAKEGKSYEEWAASAKSLGINNFEDALENAGYTNAAVQQQYQKYLTQAGSEQSAAAEAAWKDEQRAFWEGSRSYYTLESDNTSKIVELLSTDSKGILYSIYDTLHSGSHTVFSTLHKFMSTWIDYVVNNSVYDQAFGGTSKSDYLAAIRADEKDESNTAIKQLAQILVDNAKDLRDPTVQTNALLAQILLLVEAISHQNNGPTGWSLADSLSGLTLGLTKPTV